MVTPTSPENLKMINNFVSKNSDIIHGNFYCRWMDEKEYEDIKDYGKEIQKLLPVGMTMTKMNKRPFGFNFTVGTDAEYQFICKSGSVEWKRIK